MRLNVSKFNGADLDAWIFSINEYFKLLETTLEQRLRISRINLEGDVAECKWIRGHKCPGKFLLLMAEVGANPDSEIHADPTYYLEDKVNAEGDGNVMTEDKGGGRTKRVTVAPAWHKDFVMHLDNHHTYQLFLDMCLSRFWI
ncbi:hypothetical protein Tco_1488314, partial [Tanacetum coccineum]